jgi:hypothetical protein
MQSTGLLHGIMKHCNHGSVTPEVVHPPNYSTRSCMDFRRWTTTSSSLRWKAKSSDFAKLVAANGEWCRWSDPVPGTFACQGSLSRRRSGHATRLGTRWETCRAAFCAWRSKISSYLHTALWDQGHGASPRGRVSGHQLQDHPPDVGAFARRFLERLEYYATAKGACIGGGENEKPGCRELMLISLIS